MEKRYVRGRRKRGRREAKSRVGRDALEFPSEEFEKVRARSRVFMDERGIARSGTAKRERRESLSKRLASLATGRISESCHARSCTRDFLFYAIVRVRAFPDRELASSSPRGSTLTKDAWEFSAGPVAPSRKLEIYARLVDIIISFFFFPSFFLIVENADSRPGTRVIQ